MCLYVSVHTVGQNGGNISALVAGGGEDDDLLFCYVLHTWMV